MSPWDKIRQAIRARIREITKSGMWHQEDVISSAKWGYPTSESANCSAPSRGKRWQSP